MAEIQEAVRLRRAAAAVVFALLLGQAGCAGLDGFLGTAAGPAKAPAFKVVATWIPQVVTEPDTMHDGNPVQCLAGRVYLFGADMTHEVAADGTMVVDLFDPTVVDPATGKARHVDRWLIDNDTLNHKFLHRDLFGWGYTLVLPWSNYRPDATRVEMRVRYQPKDGSPLFAEPAVVTLGGQAGQPVPTQTANAKP
jgi:hypothetical protein